MHPAQSDQAKYKRRWVEVTSETLAYGASPQDVRSGGGGGARVYSARDLLWVRAEEGGAKFTVGASAGAPCQGPPRV